MAFLSTVLRNPRYAFVRGVGRFSIVRRTVTSAKRIATRHQTRRQEGDLEARMSTTLFPEVDRYAFVAHMDRCGCAFGLILPSSLVDGIVAYADSNPVFAFRDGNLGFMVPDRARAAAALGKEILLAQYFNALRDCSAIQQLALDPLLNWIALRYLGSVPTFLGCNLWWTYPIRPSRAEQMEHAHFFHRDIDDFKFIKFFFYLTDVEPGDGGHWIVAGSHRKSPHIRLKDNFTTRRFEDAEISAFYDTVDILEVTGRRGLGFAEDTLCVHKAASPSRNPRLILQLQFALFDLGVGSDARNEAGLHMIAGERPQASGSGRSR